MSPPEIGRPITAKEVAEWFKAAAKRGPWPDEQMCEPIAMRLEARRTGKPFPTTQAGPQKAMKAARELLKTLPDWQEFWQQGKTNLDSAESTIAAYMREVSQPLNDLRNALEMAEEAIDRLRTTLFNVEPLLDFPPLSIHKRITPWHNDGRLIFLLAVSAWASVGRRELSFETGSPLTLMIAYALARLNAGTEAPSHKAISNMLKRLPSEKTRLKRLRTKVTQMN